MSEFRKIEKIWAVIADNHEDGEEGVVAAMTQMGWMPLIASDPKRLPMLRKAAQEISVVEPNKNLRLVEFSGPIVVEVIAKEAQ